jgi:transcriptional/translational regulatory protein YebC/TACO1
VLTKHGGSMGQEGSVSWQFTRKAFFNIPREGNKYDQLFEIAVEAGADDVIEDEDYFEIVGPVETFKNIHDKLRAAHIDPDESGLRMDPNQEVDLGLEETIQVMKVIDILEELDDVQAVYTNLRVTDEALERLV